MQQHWAVFFFEDVFTDFYYIVGIYSKDIAVKGCVVEFAEGKAVCYYGLSFGVAIGDYVGGVEKFSVFESAHGALFAVCLQYAFAEGCLVESSFYCGCGVFSL